MTRSILAGLVALLVFAAPAAASHFEAGSPGLGDLFFPLAGNGGYDVKHYSLDLDYLRATNQLDGEATIVARAEQNLSRFNLDLRGYEISDLEVNGRDAGFTRDGQELTVIPRHGLHRNLSFVVRSWYARNKHGNVTTADFIEAAERASGQQLDAFFDVWLFQPVKPTTW